MLDFKLEDIDGILVRYNVALEKEMTPDEAAEELYPKDELIYPIAKAIYEGEEDDVVDALQAAIDAGKKPIDLINDALMVGMGVVTQLYDEGIIFLPNVMMSADAMLQVSNTARPRPLKFLNQRAKLSAMLQKVTFTTSERTLLLPSSEQTAMM